MKTLTKDQIRRKTQVLERLKSDHANLQCAIESYNLRLTQIWSEIEAKIEAFNLAVEEFNSFTQEVHEAQESYFEDRSDAWREAEQGEEYREWMAAWDCPVNTFDQDPPEEIDDPDPLDLEMMSDAPGQ